jgi:hypothetical protein
MKISIELEECEWEHVLEYMKTSRDQYEDSELMQRYVKMIGRKIHEGRILAIAERAIMKYLEKLEPPMRVYFDEMCNWDIENSIGWLLVRMQAIGRWLSLIVCAFECIYCDSLSDCYGKPGFKYEDRPCDVE